MNQEAFNEAMTINDRMVTTNIALSDLKIKLQTYTKMLENNPNEKVVIPIKLSLDNAIETIKRQIEIEENTVVALRKRFEEL